MNAPKLLAQAIPNVQIDTRGLPVIPFGELLTFFIRGLFVIAGLAALFYGLLGGIAWITSGGGKDEVQAARDKIQAAIIGVFILILVLSIIWTLENVIFQRNICFGISCPVTIPQLKITPLPGGANNSTGTQNSEEDSNIFRRSGTTTTTTTTTSQSTTNSNGGQLPATGGQ